LAGSGAKKTPALSLLTDENDSDESPEQIATKTGIYFAAGDTSVRFTLTSKEV